MNTFEVAAARILAPISALLRQPLAEHDRKVVRELFEIVRTAKESEAHLAELEQRVLALQQENLELAVRNRALSEVSSRDALTGLYNRGYVLEKIDSELNRALRHGSPMSVLLLDVDHFKRVNDTWGHAAGDAVLKCIGKLLRDSCRVYDVPGRYGGEEFCVVLPETPAGNTTVVAERIRQRVEATSLTYGDEAIAVTASIGIAGMEDDDGGGAILSPAALIERADRALYSAKNRGRNRIETWDRALRSGAENAIGH